MASTGDERLRAELLERATREAVATRSAAEAATLRGRQVGPAADELVASAQAARATAERALHDLHDAVEPREMSSLYQNCCRSSVQAKEALRELRAMSSEDDVTLARRAESKARRALNGVLDVEDFLRVDEVEVLSKNAKNLYAKCQREVKATMRVQNEGRSYEKMRGHREAAERISLEIQALFRVADGILTQTQRKRRAREEIQAEARYRQMQDEETRRSLERKKIYDEEAHVLKTVHEATMWQAATANNFHGYASRQPSNPVGGGPFDACANLEAKEADGLGQVSDRDIGLQGKGSCSKSLLSRLLRCCACTRCYQNSEVVV